MVSPGASTRDSDHGEQVVGVASPATYVAKNGSYKTRHDDVVINTARLYFPGSMLPANYVGPVSADGSGHKFVESYISPNALRSLIRADIVAQTTTVVDGPCSLDPSGCKPHTLYTSNASTQATYDFGKTKRTIKVRFTTGGDVNGGVGLIAPDNDANNILAVTPPNANAPGEGSTPYYNCAVPGNYTYTFNYDPAVLGTTKLSLWVGGCGYGNSNICIDCIDEKTGKSSCD